MPETPPDTDASIDAEFANDPAWWRDAVLLERANKIDEAEGMIRKAIDHIGLYSQLAYLHELRTARLLAAGDLVGAETARKRAIDHLYTYAGCATSGGEGAALSLERDQRVRELGPEIV